MHPLAVIVLDMVLPSALVAASLVLVRRRAPHALPHAAWVVACACTALGVATTAMSPGSAWIFNPAGPWTIARYFCAWIAACAVISVPATLTARSIVERLVTRGASPAVQFGQAALAAWVVGVLAFLPAFIVQVLITGDGP